MKVISAYVDLFIGGKSGGNVRIPKFQMQWFACCFSQLNINDTIEICEGGEPGQISFIFTSSPEAICGDAQNCKVFIDIEIETGNYPLLVSTCISQLIKCFLVVVL